ncbi:MAG: T9SS type A sorting domain-containing protein, partial [Bacteroidota bacterium]
MNLDMEIDHNWFHDTESRGDLKKAAGIYLDNDAGDVKVHHNVVYNTEWSSIQINWNGTDLDIFNNTIWNGSAAFGAWHKPGTAFSNVKVWNNLTNKNSLEPQSDKQNNLVMAEGASPFTAENSLDWTLKSGSSAIDFGREIAGITDGFAGSAPDAGAYEFGNERWLAGALWDLTRGAASRCYNLPGESCTAAPVSSEDPDVRRENRYLQVFPNPATSRLYFKELNQRAVLQLVDINGRVLRTNLRGSILAQDGLDVASMAAGIYLLTDDQGHATRFVKR